MKLNNEHITEYLEYYESLKSPGFAVLLKGEWGSGKTYFVKKHFNIEDTGFSLESKALYVSLYGVTNISSIDSLIFQKLHPFWTSKQARLIGNIGRGLLKASLKIDLNSDQKDDGAISLQIPDLAILEEFSNLDDKILIFDDLERCAIAINDLLGYFNYFVEHQNLKIVIIADENKIGRNIISSEEVKASQEVKDYDAIKEKVIGKSLTINSSFDDAYHDFIKKYIENDICKQFLEEQLEYVKEIFDSVKSQNLRILKSIIIDFYRIYSSLLQEACNNRDFLKDILKSITILLLEIKLGRLREKDIINFLHAESEYSKKGQSKSKTTESESSNGTKEKSSFSHMYDFFEKLKNCYSFSISDL